MMPAEASTQRSFGGAGIAKQMGDSLAGSETLISMGLHDGSPSLEQQEKESGGLKAPHSPQAKACEPRLHFAEQQNRPFDSVPLRENPEIPGGGPHATSGRGPFDFRNNYSNKVCIEGAPPTSFLRIENATISREWICPVYDHLHSSSHRGNWGGNYPSRDPSPSEESTEVPERADGEACCHPCPCPSEEEVPGATASTSSACLSLPESSQQSETPQTETGSRAHVRPGYPDACCHHQPSVAAEPTGSSERGEASSNPQLGEEGVDDPRTSYDWTQETKGPIEGPRRPCLVLLDLDNTLIPTGWIMACWRRMQVYFGLQQAVSCIRKGLEQAELVGALRALFDDLRLLRERRHTQIVIVTNAGLRTVQEFYLKMCLPELKELCEREKVYIHSTEHFARRVGPIPPMTEEEAFCEFYTALKYHEFDFVVQRYLNALLCQARIPLQGASQEEESGSPSATQPCRLEAPIQVEGSSFLPRRSALPFCKRARLSTQRESSAAPPADCGSSNGSADAYCDQCTEDAGGPGGPLSGPADEGSPAEASPRSPLTVKEPPVEAVSPASPQQQGQSCCCCGLGGAPAETADDKKRAVPLSLREQLQAAAVVHARAESERKDSSPAPSPSESPRGFDPFPLDFRCDLISAGDQVCEIHAACRVARHFSGHVKFAKLLFLRDPEDPRFLAQTPTRFIAQLKELHSSLLHVISCDEETLDERGHPRWVRRGSFSQVTIVAPERLEAPPRHCAAARVRHAFEYLRRRRTKSSKTATNGVRARQDLTMREGLGGDQSGQVPDISAAKRHILSCPLEWERNAVANPPSTPPCRELNAPVISTPFGDERREVLDGGQLAIASESRSA